MRNRGNVFVFAPAAIALWFIYGFVLNYVGGDPGRFGIYGPRREWLTMHILAGSGAILLGPLQFWLGLNQRAKVLHRVLGIGYVTAVAMSGTAAFYLAFHTDFGWVFGMGLTAMGCAWIVTTALATIAICRGMVEQHREWMIRSYVVTFGFVTLRVLTTVFEMVRAGTLVERMAAASWFAWSVPLLVTETVLQGRKIFVRAPIAAQLQGVSAYSTSPEPAAFDLPGSESSYLHRP
ncbi:MAG TPA: DUF2306 domain-containing protein [Terriglobia bacterium]|jgi:hypothetical protein